MVKEFRNNTDDYNKGGFGRYEGVGPSSALDRNAGDDSSDDSDDEEDLEEESDGTETQEKGVVREGYIAWKAKNQAIKCLTSSL